MGQRIARTPVVAEAELELVAGAAGGGKGAAADVEQMPRLGVLCGQVRSVRVLVVEVDAAGVCCPANRIEAISPPIPRVFGVDEEVRSKRVIVLDLPQPVQRVKEALLGIEVALIPG